MRISHNVAPRYTAGSPAMVDRTTAERVVEQEREHYAISLTGAYGTEAKITAETKGLAWIVWETLEKGAWLTKADMLTGEITKQRIGHNAHLSAPIVVQPAHEVV